jgi:hypothetical protein
MRRRRDRNTIAWARRLDRSQKLARAAPLAGHQGRHLVDAEEQDRLLDRLGLAPAAVDRRIRQFQERARHADVAGDDAPDRFRARVGRSQLLLQVGQQAGTRWNADRLDQGVDGIVGRAWSRENGCCGHGESGNDAATMPHGNIWKVCHYNPLL